MRRHRAYAEVVGGDDQVSALVHTHPWFSRVRAFTNRDVDPGRLGPASCGGILGKNRSSVQVNRFRFQHVGVPAQIVWIFLVYVLPGVIGRFPRSTRLEALEVGCRRSHRPCAWSFRRTFRL